jgi:hypothetical protein
MTFQSNLNAAQASTQQDNIMNSFIKYYIDNELQLLKDLILGGAPEALDTLKELADAISSDPDFFQSMADSNAALQTAIDAVQADVDQNESDSDAAIAAETSARTVAVDAEASTRQAAIDAVNALITTLQTEAAARLVRIEALEADPTTATAVAAVQADVDQNESDADAADAALSGRLDVLETDPTTAAAVAAVQSDVDQNESDSDAADAALSGRLDVLEADPTTATAVAAVQSDVDQNEADADAAIALKLDIASPSATGTLTVDTNASLKFDSNLTKVENVLRGTGINIGNNIELLPAAAGGRVEITGDLILDASDLTDAADDTAAAAAGVVVGQVYHNSGALRVRLS